MEGAKWTTKYLKSFFINCRGWKSCQNTLEHYSMLSQKNLELTLVTLASSKTKKNQQKLRNRKQQKNTCTMFKNNWINPNKHKYSTRYVKIPVHQLKCSHKMQVPTRWGLREWKKIKVFSLLTEERKVAKIFWNTIYLSPTIGWLLDFLKKMILPLISYNIKMALNSLP